jgi:hypothetical protein
MRKTYIGHAIIFTATLFFVSSCSKEQLPDAPPPAFKPPVVKISTSTAKNQVPRYVYKGDKYRDPFIPLTGSGFSSINSDAVPTPNIGSLSLKGIVDDGNKRMAVITGGGITFVLKDGRLFDNRNRQIRGISGYIKKNSVILIGADRTSKELNLRTKE